MHSDLFFYFGQISHFCIELQFQCYGKDRCIIVLMMTVIVLDLHVANQVRYKGESPK